MVTEVSSNPIRIPSCARSRITALGKLSTLYHGLDGDLILDKQCAIEQISINSNI